jgi:hypothetical protein
MLDWEKPRLCRLCKAAWDAQCALFICRICGTSFKAKDNRDKSPRYCRTCRHAHPEKHHQCRSCKKSFTIPPATLLFCAENNWELPTRCAECKAEVKRVASIAESRHEKDWAGRTKVDENGKPINFHYDKTGNLVGQTKTEKTAFGNMRVDENGHAVRVHSDADGAKAGYSKTEKTIFGNVRKDETGKPIQGHYTKNGERASETRREKNVLGDVKKDETGEPIAVHRSQSGEQTSTTTQKLTWWGRLKQDVTGQPIKYREKGK